MGCSAGDFGSIGAEKYLSKFFFLSSSFT